MNGNRIDRLRRFLHIYQSSSPSILLMAGIGNALQVVEEQNNMIRKIPDKLSEDADRTVRMQKFKLFTAGCQTGYRKTDHSICKGRFVRTADL